MDLRNPGNVYYHAHQISMEFFVKYQPKTHLACSNRSGWMMRRVSGGLMAKFKTTQSGWPWPLMYLPQVRFMCAGTFFIKKTLMPCLL